MPIESKAKRSLKLAIGLCTYFVDLAVGAAWSVTGAKRPARCVVLYYHSVPAELRAKFARQMDMVVRYAQPISAATTSTLSEGCRYVAVTFDDAFENVLDNAVPEMMTRNIPAAIFVVTGCMGRPPNWMNTGVGQKTMSIEQLQNLPDLMTIGAHTATHPFLPSLEEEAAKREIVESRRMLEKLLGKRVGLFSFPHGAHNANLDRICREAGYDRIFTIEPVLGLTRPDEFVTGRVYVEASDWPLEFRLKLLGAYRGLNFAFAIKRWIRSNIRRLLKR